MTGDLLTGDEPALHPRARRGKRIDQPQSRLLGRGDHLLHLREQSGIDRCRIAPRHRRSMQVLAGEAEYRRVEC